MRIQFFIIIIFSMMLFSFFNASLAESKKVDNTNIDSIISCPLQPKPILGWNLVQANCGFATDRSFIYIKVMNFCNYSEKVYLLCCYNNKSLLRIVPKNISAEILNKNIWQLLHYNSKLTQASLQEEKCDPVANHVDFSRCQVKLSVKKIKHEFKQYSFSELMYLGQKVYQENCSICHKYNANGMPPIISPLIKSVTMSQPIDQTAHRVICGKPGTIMHPFGFFVVNKQLTEDDLAAVITYIRNSWGNSDKEKLGINAGGSIQPSQIPTLKEKCHTCCNSSF